MRYTGPARSPCLRVGHPDRGSPPALGGNLKLSRGDVTGTGLPERTPRFALTSTSKAVRSMAHSVAMVGVVVTGFAGDARAEGVAIQADGRIVRRGRLPSLRAPGQGQVRPGPIPRSLSRR